MADVLARYRSARGGPENLARAATIEALSEVIKEHRADPAAEAPPSATEYFAAIMTALQGPRSPQRAPLVFLLSVVLAALPQSVVHLKGDECLATLLKLLRSEVTQGEEENNHALRHGLTAVGVLLASREATKAVWALPQTNQAMNLLLSTLNDDRPKLRKVAQQATLTVLEAHRASPFPGKLTCQVLTKVLSGATVSDCTPVSRLLHFLESAMTHLAFGTPVKSSGALCREIVNCVRLGHAVLAASGFRALDTFFRGSVARVEGADKPVVGELTTRVADLASTVRAIAEIMDDLQRQKFITSDATLCGTYVRMMQTAETALTTVSAANGDLVSELGKITHAKVTCMSAGVHMASEAGKSPAGQPQVIFPVGTLTALIRSHPELSTKPDVLLQVVESLSQILTPQFEEAWSVAFEPLRAYFDVLSPIEPIAKVSKAEDDIVLKVAAIREKVINPVTGVDHSNMIVRWRSPVERVFGSAVGSLGAERVLQLLPLRGAQQDARGLAPLRAWMLPILRSSIASGRATVTLEFFRNHLLAIAEECEDMAEEAKDSANSAKMLQTRAMQIWSLLGPYCAHASDISSPSGFAPLAPVLGNAMVNEKYPDLLEYVCAGLQNVSQAAFETEDDEGVAIDAVGKFARNFLPLLFNLYDEKALSDRADIIFNTIAAYAKVAPSELLNTLFRQLLEQLILATSTGKPSLKKAAAKREKANKARREAAEDDDDEDDDEDDSDIEGDGGKSDDDDDDDDDLDSIDGLDLDDENARKVYVLTGLSLALIPQLDEESLHLLFKAVRPFVDEEEDSVLQKRGYKVLESICEHQPEWVRKMRNELLNLIRSSFFASSSNSKAARLKTMVHLFRALDATPPDELCGIIADVLGEVILCTKETNTKARSASYVLLAALAETLASCFGRDGDQADGLRQFLQMLMAGLAGQTPHMRSASLNGIARIIALYGKQEDLQEDFVKLGEAALVLLNEKSREVAKSGVVVAKMLVIKLPVATVEELLPTVLAALLPWADMTQNRFRTKIRIICERIIKRIGYDAIVNTGAIPEDHKLLVYLRKQDAYKKRRNARQAEDGEPKANKRDKGSRSRDNDNMEDLDDSDAEVAESKPDPARLAGRGGRKARRAREAAAAREDIIMDEAGDAIDLLGATALGRVKRVGPSKETKDAAAEAGFKMSADGRLIIPGAKTADGEESDNEREGDGLTGRSRKRRAYSDDDDDEKELAKIEAKKRRSAARQAGSEYKAQKASGDVKKKSQKFEPYAYIQLNPKMLNKRRRHDSARQFKGVTGKRVKDNAAPKGGRGKTRR